MWQKITVEQYQQIAQLNKRDMEEVDKLIAIIGVLFNLTEEQVNDLPVTRFHKLTAQVSEMFAAPPTEGTPHKYVKANGKRYRLYYEVGKMRFAQYVEAQHFLKGGIIENLHLIAASIAAPVRFRVLTGKNDSEKHAEVAEDFLQANFLELYQSVVFFCSVFNKWNKGYPGLFGIDDSDDDEPAQPERHRKSGFDERYGWIYSATQIRGHEAIRLEEVWDIPVMRAFNDLAYLKAHDEHQKYLTKQAHAGIHLT